MDRWLVSPTAIGFLPPLVIQVVTLVYFMSLRKKSVTTRLFIGWMACLTVFVGVMFASHVICDPIGGYIHWIGGISTTALANVFMLQFVYRFPRSLYPREARVALIASILIFVGILTLIIFEGLTRTTQAVYGFEQFFFGLVSSADEQFFTSTNVFDVLNLATFLWVLALCLRQSVRLSNPEPIYHTLSSRLRATAGSLVQPRGKKARAARAFASLYVLAAISVMLSALEPRRVVPQGSFAISYMLAVFGVVLIYINRTSDPSTFMAKLVGISLLALLVSLALATPLIRELQDKAYEQARQAELTSIKALLKTGRPDHAPEAVGYVASHPFTDGLFSSRYRLLFSRVEHLTAQSLAKGDAQLTDLLQQGRHFIALQSLLAEHPWLKPAAPDFWDRVSLEHLQVPEGVRAYRGYFAPPKDQYIRYAFTLDSSEGIEGIEGIEDAKEIYEVGYSYLEYRRAVHREILPLVALTLGGSLVILLVFPYFFRSSLVTPIYNLLEGTRQVDEGNLTVSVPVHVEDEIGFLTRSFNRMVNSLRVSQEQLHSEILERQRAEEEVRALNVTLEQRVLDRTRDLSALYKVSAVASQALDLGTVLKDSLSHTVQALRGDGGALYLHQEDADSGVPMLELAVHQGVPPDVVSQIRVLPIQDGPMGWIVSHHEPLLIPDITADPRVSQLLPWNNPAEVLLAPMQAEGRVLGVLGVGRWSHHSFSAEEVALLASIADQVGVAVWTDQLRQLVQDSRVLEERQRLARDLHDAVTQSLYGLVAFSEAGQAQVEAGGTEKVGHTLARIGDTARQALKEMRLFIHHLRPPVLEKEGLVAALHQRLAAVEGRADMQARLLADETIKLPLAVEEALYQIAQEALNNTLRHANASSVTVYLGREGKETILEVIDDGCGFDPEKTGDSGMGLANMCERAAAVEGRLKVMSMPGSGTRVRVMVGGSDE